jgi:hypothetical protein
MIQVSNFKKMDCQMLCKMEEIMQKLSEFRHNHHPSGVKMFAKFLKTPAEYPTACCGDESGQPEGLIQFRHGSKSECTCGL